jgi:hypothetical protein
VQRGEGEERGDFCRVRHLGDLEAEGEEEAGEELGCFARWGVGGRGRGFAGCSCGCGCGCGWSGVGATYGRGRGQVGDDMWCEACGEDSGAGEDKQASGRAERGVYGHVAGCGAGTDGGVEGWVGQMVGQNGRGEEDGDSGG